MLYSPTFVLSIFMFRICLFASLFLLSSTKLFSQDDEENVSTLKEVTITGYRTEPSNLTSFNILKLSTDSSHSGTLSLSEFMAKQPGISMLSTGLGITKPVIRGLYGNRVLILLNGLRFDNQQWQEEHGLGLSNMGISGAEIIKGPFGILYGTEALGGVINLIEEEKPHDEKPHWDAGLTQHSNTGGTSIQLGYRKVRHNRWWRLRGGLENHGDYTDGNHNRILNSRFNGYGLKATYGFDRNKWTSINNLSSSFNRYGFIFSDVYSFIHPDARWSRSLKEFPFHAVLLHTFSSENSIYIGNRGKLQVNAGVQSNRRMENEGGGAISLDMHLLTFQYIARYEYELGYRNKLIVSHLHSIEDNTNYGARKIIPDARMQEANLSAFLETRLMNTLLWENGLGIGEKMIKTYFTATVNGQGKEVQPFNKFSPYYNAFSGFTFFPNSHINLKANFSTGVRVANLAELSSNGLHEGIFTYEIGNPHLKNEQLYSMNFFANWMFRKMELSFSPFYNYFSNYIYLSPTSEHWFGFPVYRYRQQHCKQLGAEFGIVYKYSTQLRFQLQASGMNSKTDDGNYTPYTPAMKITPGIQYHVRVSRFPLHANLYMDGYLKQNRTAPNEIPSKAYQLWNAAVNTEWKTGEHTCYLSINGNNLLNAAYFDNLSRFKNFGLFNMGRNISLEFKFVL